MELHVLRSSSEGNGYILQNADEALIIECGVHYGMAMKAVAHDRKKVVGCIVSHEHGDHSRYINEYLNACIPTFATTGTIEALRENGKLKSPMLPLMCEHRQMVGIGRFEVTPFNVSHDAAEPVGFYIWHPDMGSLLFATDTDTLAERFEPLTHILIECNYDLGRLMDNPKLPQETKERIVTTHMSYAHCVDTLRAMDLSQCRNIVRIHLSNDNSTEQIFVEGVKAATGKPTVAAAPGMVLNIDLKPF